MCAETETETETEMGGQMFEISLSFPGTPIHHLPGYPEATWEKNMTDPLPEGERVVRVTGLDGQSPKPISFTDNKQVCGEETDRQTDRQKGRKQARWDKKEPERESTREPHRESALADKNGFALILFFCLETLSKLPGGASFGSLTQLGRQDALDLGQKLRHRYVNFLGFIQVPEERRKGDERFADTI